MRRDPYPVRLTWLRLGLIPSDTRACRRLAGYNVGSCRSLSAQSGHSREA